MEDKPRYSRVSDILDLVTYMLSKVRGITISDIMERYNVSRRTAERMRDSLLNIFPDIEEIEVAEDNYKHWGFSSRSYSRLISLTPEEIANLEQIKESADNIKVAECLNKTIEKLKAINTKHHTSLEDEIEMLMHTEGFAIRQKPNYKIDLNVLNMLRDAIRELKSIHCVYHDKIRELQPLGIIYGEKIYLVAKEPLKGDGIYNYILHKIKDIKVTGKKKKKGDFDLDSYAKKPFGVYQGEIYNVKLLFSAEIAEDILYYNFHPTQNIKLQADGNILVTFQASGTLEIIWHLFKWGKDVKILSPNKLKKAYRDYINSINID